MKKKSDESKERKARRSVLSEIEDPELQRRLSHIAKASKPFVIITGIPITGVQRTIDWSQKRYVTTISVRMSALAEVRLISRSVPNPSAGPRTGPKFIEDKPDESAILMMISTMAAA